MNVKAIVDLLNREYDADIDPSYYDLIEDWRQWWFGAVKTFHRVLEIDADGKKHTRDLYSMRMAKKICEDWASYLLNEKTEITVQDKASAEFLLGSDKAPGVLNDVDFWPEANALIEKAFYSGTGAFVIKLDGLPVTEDGTVQRAGDVRIRMEYLPAMCIFPLTVQYHKITEVAFASEAMVRGVTYIYLEPHTLDDNGNYVIRNRYYKVEGNILTEADLPDGMAARINTGSPYPFFAVVRPNIVNPYRDSLGLGCAVYSQAIDNLKGVDIAYNNFNRDLWLGGKKVFYNRELTKVMGNDSEGNPIYAAPDDVLQQLFVSVGDHYVDGKDLVHEFNPALRVQDNRDAVQAQLDYLSFKCGMGTRHYRFDGTGAGAAVTATQYTGEKQDLKQSAAKHGIVIEAAIQDIVRAILWTGQNILGEAVDPETPVMVQFSDGYITSDEEKRAQDISDVRDGLMQPWEYRVRWYGEDEATAKAMTETQLPAFGEQEYPPGEDDA